MKLKGNLKVGIPVNQKNYVRYEDQDKLAAEDLSAEQRQFLVNLNSKLTDIEKGIKVEGQALIDQLEKRVKDTNDWLEDYEIECYITFYLQEDDPDYDEDKDNMLVELMSCVVFSKLKKREWGIADGNDHNTLHGWVKCSMVDEYHCYLHHSLYDYTDLGWINMLRIGTIWVDTRLTDVGGDVRRDQRQPQHELRCHIINKGGEGRGFACARLRPRIEREPTGRRLIGHDLPRDAQGDTAVAGLTGVAIEHAASPARLPAGGDVPRFQPARLERKELIGQMLETRLAGRLVQQHGEGERQAHGEPPLPGLSGLHDAPDRGNRAENPPAADRLHPGW